MAADIFINLKDNILRWSFWKSDDITYVYQSGSAFSNKLNSQLKTFNKQW